MAEQMKIVIEVDAANAKTTIADLEQGIKKLGSASADASKSAKGLGDEKKVLADKTKDAAIASDQLSTSLLRFVSVAAGIKAIIDIKDASIALTGQMSRLSVGSTNAAAEFEYLRLVTDKYGVSLRDTADGYSKLAAASKGTMMEGEGARRAFEGITAAGAAMFMSNEQLNGSLKAFSDMISKGAVQMEELKGQLGDRLPGALNIAAKAMGITTAALIDQIEKGQLLASDFLPRLGDALKQTYEVDALNAANSAKGAFARLETAIFTLQTTIGNNTVMPVLGAAAKVLTDNINIAAFAIGTTLSLAIGNSIAGLIAKTIATRADTAATVAAVAAENALALSKARSLAGIGMGTAAMTASAASMTAAAGAATLASRALGLLGGPIGWITTLLGLGATAWSIWGGEAESAINKARELSSGDLAERLAQGKTLAQATREQLAAEQQSLKTLMSLRGELDKKYEGHAQRQKEYQNKDYKEQKARLDERIAAQEKLIKETEGNLKREEAAEKARVAAVASSKNDAEAKAAERRARAVESQLADYERLKNAANRAHLDERSRKIAAHEEDLRLMNEKRAQGISRDKLTPAQVEETQPAFDAAKAAIIAQHEWEMAELEANETIKADFAILKRNDALKRIDEESRARQRKMKSDMSGLDVEYWQQRGDFQLASLDAEKARITDMGIWSEEHEQAYQKRRAEIIESVGAESDRLKIERIQQDRLDQELTWQEEIDRLVQKGEMTLEIEREYALKRVEANRMEAHSRQAIDDAAMNRQRDADRKKNEYTSIEGKKAYDFAKALSEGKYQDAVKMGMNMIGEAGKTNKRLWEIQKAYNLATAIMNVPTMISEALVKSKLPPPWNIAQAVAVGAVGLAQVAAIASSQFSGGGGGGGGASAPSSGAAATPYAPSAPAPSPFAPTTPAAAPSLNITVNAPAGLVDPIVAQQLADSLAPHFTDAFRRGLNTSMVMA